jgi:hypothetical protein
MGNAIPVSLLDFAVIVYEEAAAAAAQAAAYATAQSLGASIKANATAQAQVSFRTITLELRTAGSSNSTSGSPGTPNSLYTASTITLGVSPRSVSGFAQKIDITSTARQNVHQTVVGNYVDEWGIAPGQLEVDCIVTYLGTPGAQIQAFFDLLEKAKRTSPLDDALPSVLRFHDAVLQRSLIITQDSVRFSEDVAAPNQAHLTISATILHDYGTAQDPATQTAAPAPVPPGTMNNAMGSGLQVFT